MKSAEDAKGLIWRAGGVRRRSLDARIPKAMVPGWAYVVAGILMIWALTTANPLVTAFSLLLLPLFALLLWRSGEPPVLLFACTMQWLQAATAIFYNNGYGKMLSDYGGPNFTAATWLSLIGGLVLAVGMRTALVRMHPAHLARMRTEILQMSPLRLFLTYLILFAASRGIESVAFRFPSITQPLLAVASLKWVPAILLLYTVMEQRSGYPFLLLLVAIEFFTGILGYFSGFASIFFILCVVIGTSERRLSMRRWVAAGLVAAAMLITGSVWTAIKGEYRAFLNQGTGEQVALEPVGERVARLALILRDLDSQKFADGWEESLLRMSYVHFFGQCIGTVPNAMPYERGALWAGAIKHVFMPRLFFPNKPAISDSLRTQKYTGSNVAGEEQGTSIGIGYMAESYVDFGPYLMFAPVFLLGVFYGLTYRLFTLRKNQAALGLATGCAILIFGAYHIETSNIKLVGGNTMAVLVLGFLYWRFGSVFMRRVSPRRVARSSKRRARSAGREAVGAERGAESG